MKTEDDSDEVSTIKIVDLHNSEFIAHWLLTME